MKTITLNAAKHHMPVQFVILIGVLLFMLQPMGTDLYLPSMPALAQDFGVSVGQVANTMTSFLIGFASSQLFAGPIADRFGRRKVAMVGVVIYIIASAVCATATQFNTLLVARFFQATGACTCFVVARAIVRDCFAAKDGAWVVSKINSFMVAAPITGILLGGFLVSTLGWRFNFYALFVFGFLVLGIVYFKLQETLNPKDMQRINVRSLLISYQLILSNRTFLSFTAAACVACAGLFCHLSASSIVYVKVLGESPWWYSVCFAIGCLGYLSGTILLRRWIGRIGLHGVLIRAGIVQFFSILCSLLIAFIIQPHWLGIASCNFVFLMGYGMAMSACQAGSIAPFPDRAGTAGSLMGAIQIAGGAIAGWWMGVAYNGTVFPMLLSQWVCASALLILSLTIIRRYGKL